MRRCSFAGYNIGPANSRREGQTNRQAVREGRREVRTLLSFRDNQGRRHKVVVVFEALGWRLPRVWAWWNGYRLIRDTSTPGRANIAVFVLERLETGRPRWIDHKKTWPRILHPGMHPARASLVVPVEDWTLIFGHGPQDERHHFPERTKIELAAARAEWLDITADLMNTAPGPVLLLSDPNGLDEALLRRLPETAAKGGTNVECAHVVGAVLDQAQKVSSVDSVPMRSDHHGALLGKARKRRD